MIPKSSKVAALSPKPETLNQLLLRDGEGQLRRGLAFVEGPAATATQGPHEFWLQVLVAGKGV